MNSVQNPSVIPLNPGLLVGIHRSWIITLPPQKNGSIIHQLIINQPSVISFID